MFPPCFHCIPAVFPQHLSTNFHTYKFGLTEKLFFNRKVELATVTCMSKAILIATTRSVRDYSNSVKGKMKVEANYTRT